MKNINIKRKINILAIFVFLAVLAVITADMTVTFITKEIKVPFKKEKKVSYVKKAAEKKRPLVHYKEVFDKNIFDAAVSNPNFFKGGHYVKDEKTSFKDDTSQIEEPLKEETESFNQDNYELFGTIVSDPKDLSTATIYDKTDRKHEIYGLKEYNRFIDGKYKILKITRNSVEVKTPDGSVTLKVVEEKDEKPVERPPRREPFRRPPRNSRSDLSKDDEGITKLSNNSYVIDQRFYESLTKDVSSLMTLQRQINFIPKLDENNKPIGFEIRRITPGSLFQKIGLRRGDTVKSINGRVLNAMSVQEALQLLNEMKNETNISLDIMRNNQDSSIAYEVR